MDKTQFPRKQQWIDEISPGDEVNGLFLLSAASQQQARNGPFWRLEIKDATGALEARIWSPTSQQYTGLVPGMIAEVEGRADSFKDQVQVNVTRLRTLDAEAAALVDTAAFLPSSARPPADMLADMEKLCRTEFTHKPWRVFALAVLSDADIRPRLLAAPAAKGVHHAWVGGLLEHTLSVARLCLLMADHYPQLDRQTLLAGALFHDLGKIWELSGGLANDYTDEGRLVGHINICLGKLDRHLNKASLEPHLALHFKHLVLSHHGQYEYASPRLPQTAEAFALHYADNIDAKMAQCQSLFAGVQAAGQPEQPAEQAPEQAAEQQEGPVQGRWSAYQNTLGRQVYLAPSTPASGTAKRASAEPEPKVTQCSLLLKA